MDSICDKGQLLEKALAFVCVFVSSVGLFRSSAGSAPVNQGASRRRREGGNADVAAPTRVQLWLRVGQCAAYIAAGPLPLRI